MTLTALLPILNLLANLSGEIVILTLLVTIFYKNQQMTFLLPLAAMTFLGAAVEVLGILSHKSIAILPRTTNMYTYPLLTIAEFMCTLWLVMYFTAERVRLIACGIIFTALWVAAKAHIEPLHLFDSTTFSILNVTTLVCIGCIALNLASNVVDGERENGMVWILVGLALYSWLSPIILPITNIVDKEVRKDIWWLNSAAFWLRSVSIAWGLMLLRKNPYLPSPSPKEAHSLGLVLLPFGLICMFLLRAFALPPTEAELISKGDVVSRETISFCIIIFLIGSAVVFSYIRFGWGMALESLSIERSKRLFAEELNEAKKISTEYAIKDIANATIQLRDIIEEEEHDQRLKAKLIQYIDLLTIACFGLVKNSKPK